jgi:hypothetical protein
MTHQPGEFSDRLPGTLVGDAVHHHDSNAVWRAQRPNLIAPRSEMAIAWGCISVNVLLHCQGGQCGKNREG